MTERDILSATAISAAVLAAIVILYLIGSLAIVIVAAALTDLVLRFVEDARARRLHITDDRHGPGHR